MSTKTIVDGNISQGLVYLFEGGGKGKTSAAIGVAMRMALFQGGVVWISWYKTKRWSLSEMGLSSLLKDKIEMHWCGEGFYLRKGRLKHLGRSKVKTLKTGRSYVVDWSTKESHLTSAKKALLIAKEAIKNEVNLLVLDESVRAVEDGLIKEDELVDLIKSRGRTHIVITGHKATSAIRRASNLITRMVKIKHPFDTGVMAVKGLDY